MKTIIFYKNTLCSLICLALFVPVSVTFAQTKHIVNVTSNVFTPDELKISVGDTVEWRNAQGSHNVSGTKAIFPDNPESFGNSIGRNWLYTYVFNTKGKYDYQCDPHINYGMTGKIEVEAANDDNLKHMLTINFTGMDPHVGQNLYLLVVEKDSGKEVERKVEDIHSSFAVQVSGIEKDHSYRIDFYADHNNNGRYDPPPADHAWRLELNNVMGDTTINFTHNANFTDINITSGIEDIASLVTKVYPNPATAIVTIEHRGNKNNERIELFDLSGKLHQTFYQTESRVSKLNVSSVPSGVYLLRLTRDDYIHHHKLIKH